ncbi:hypothetical protein WS66_30050 [Burkholderia sp. LA-2-3-30-S1-D2]|nr:hypothetical protein WS66_30050 [Burkholderia sp. LA-2-3-30-S1-D2]KVE14346.1 hypothetical protein WS66_12575 [Burkholderia sp. LA-2-3-30-S1-D2]
MLTHSISSPTAAADRIALARAGVLDILPAHYSQLPELIRDGRLRIDVVMLQVSPPDEHGRYNSGSPANICSKR